jgi:hypothetical protein
MRRCAASSLRLLIGFGSQRVDHSATSARSRSVTVICPVAPSILTWPKNCMPPTAAGSACRAGRLDELHFGPKVLSSSFGPNVPACSGPGDEFPERLEILKLRLVGL